MDSKVQSKQILNHTKRLGNTEFLNYLKSQPTTVRITFSIEKYLQKYPVFYINSLLIFLKGRNLSFVENYLAKIHEQLFSNTSFLHQMNANITARAKCINKIKRDISRATKLLVLFQKQYFQDDEDDAVYAQWVQQEGYKAVEVEESIQNSIKILSGIFTDMMRLRQMTIYIVQKIHQWRLQLQQHSDRCEQHQEIHYFYEGVDIYQTILQDTNFIWTSKLKSYLWLQAKQDPFIIRNIIHIEEKEVKTPLQKYFLEILYPQNDLIVQKSLKCFQMLLFKYTPKIANQFQEEQLLIENYLKLQKSNHQFEQNRQIIGSTDQIEKNKQNSSQKQKSSPKKNRLNLRGWLFQQNKTKVQKFNRIIESHKQKIGLIKPFNISNYAQKSSIALAYAGNRNAMSSSKTKKQILTNKYKLNNPFFSQGEEIIKQSLQSDTQRQKGSRQTLHQSRMFKSLTKLTPVILQDPKQHLPETPKQFQTIQTGRQPSLSHAKMNSFLPQQFHQEQKIEIDDQETPLNMKQFFQVFRAETNMKKKETKIEQKNQKGEKIKTVKQFLQNSRRQRIKSLYSKRTSVSNKKQKNIQPLPQKINKSNYYDDFTKIVGEAGQTIKQSKNIFINLKPKSIPYDLIMPYIKYIAVQQHSTSHKFTQFKTSQLLKKLSDPFIHCIIFDAFTQENLHVGQVIVSQSISGRAGRLKYKIQYLNIHAFQLVISTILRVSEELLTTSPCQQVIFPSVFDKIDLVSTHFIELIDSGLRLGAKKFGKLSILQKSRPSLSGTDVRERLYIFTSDSTLKKQHELGIKMMGNYRSLKFEAKCLILCSNFRLRSKKLFSNTFLKYQQVSLGELYVIALAKVITKFHLRQLKAASYSLDSQDQLTKVLRKDAFVRNVIHNLIAHLNQQQKNLLLQMTTFSNIGDLLHYLQYKRHDTRFEFQFLKQSRFILHHQLILIEFDQQVSIDFSITTNNDICILHNHKHIPVILKKSKNAQTPLYVIPTTNQRIKLFLMNGQEYFHSTTDELDLFAYINYFFRDLHSEISLNEIPAIILPNLKQQNRRTNPVRMFDGFFNIFPERQFYSAAMITILNHWQNFYPNAILHLPKQHSLLFEYPFIIGFYDDLLKCPLVSFVYSNKNAKT